MLQVGETGINQPNTLSLCYSYEVHEHVSPLNKKTCEIMVDISCGGVRFKALEAVSVIVSINYYEMAGDFIFTCIIKFKSPADSKLMTLT
jgi:hypothetical protein